MQYQNRRPPAAPNQGDRTVRSDVDKATMQEILNGNVERLVICAKQIGEKLKQERLTTSQVRSFFGEVRQIEAEVHGDLKELPETAYRRLVLLRPKLAYQAQRERDARKGEGVAKLEAVLSPAIEIVGKDVRRFRCFVDFFEAILAYHKAAGGRDS